MAMLLFYALHLCKYRISLQQKEMTQLTQLAQLESTTVSLFLLPAFEMSSNMARNSSAELITECSDDERNQIGKQLSLWFPLRNALSNHWS